MNHAVSNNGRGPRHREVAGTALGLAGPEALVRSASPLLDAARIPLGTWAVPVVVGAAAVSLLKTMNATAVILSRSIFAMGRAGALPAGLAAIYPRFGTPHRAISLCYALTMVGLLMPPSLIFLRLAVNIWFQPHHGPLRRDWRSDRRHRHHPSRAR